MGVNSETEAVHQIIHGIKLGLSWMVFGYQLTNLTTLMP
jgi:hypothetical protein